jgi:hypothetical protein
VRQEKACEPAQNYKVTRYVSINSDDKHSGVDVDVAGNMRYPCVRAFDFLADRKSIYPAGRHQCAPILYKQRFFQKVRHTVDDYMVPWHSALSLYAHDIIHSL